MRLNLFVILIEKSCWMCLRWAICEPLPYLAARWGELTATTGDGRIDAGAFSIL